MNAAPLPRSFFERDPREVAPDLLGTLLVHGAVAGRIVETEAYLATGDPAAHAANGRTKRTEVLFGPAGHAYVFRTRQHLCLNVAVQETGVPGCVLLRAVAPTVGTHIMRCRRGHVDDRRLADGPAKLCQAMAIGMHHYGTDLCSGADLRIVAHPPSSGKVVVSPRVGISVAKDWPLRYRLVDAATSPVMVRRSRRTMT